MKRYYSHYTFIYPDIYLKNHIVELDDEDRIIKTFPFEREVEKTEFYSGLLVFCPIGIENKTIERYVCNINIGAFISEAPLLPNIDHNLISNYTRLSIK